MKLNGADSVPLVSQETLGRSYWTLIRAEFGPCSVIVIVGVGENKVVRLPHASATSIWLAMGYAVVAWAKVGNTS
jgi:hypothetical protein